MSNYINKFKKLEILHKIFIYILIILFLYLIINPSLAVSTGVLQLNNINFFETLDIALFFCQFFCIFYSYFLVLCDIIVSGGVSYG